MQLTYVFVAHNLAVASYMHESDQFSEALTLRQKVAYERFTYAGHGFIRPDHRRRVYASVVAHFREHL